MDTFDQKMADHMHETLRFLVSTALTIGAIFASILGIVLALISTNNVDDSLAKLSISASIIAILFMIIVSGIFQYLIHKSIKQYVRSMIKIANENSEDIETLNKLKKKSSSIGHILTAIGILSLLVMLVVFSIELLKYTN